ncbi:MAG: methionyl-tRNA formyltransferase [Candidatus Omnitrophica bacterium]|nr:methionyl-tRNA formyltransferase [Candidatus Omnitrophota bacterium]
MRILFIGSVEFSKKALLKLIKLNADIAGVVTKKDAGINADFADLAPVCTEKDIPYKHVEDINSKENIDWMRRIAPDIMFCFGFSHLLKEEVLQIAPMGVIGYHPARLPENRGRHPLIWALAKGLDKTASTFFFIKKGLDDGDILSQAEVLIDYSDNARSLCDRVTKRALEQIEDFLPKLKDGTFNRIPQDPARSGYWRKRVEKDGEIDFRADSRTVYNLIRALTRPYVGAHVSYKGKGIKVWAAKEVMVNSKEIDCGKVLDAAEGNILVKCGDNAILLTEHDFAKLPRKGDRL